MEKETPGSRRGTVFVYGIKAEDSQHTDDTLHRIRQEWRGWRVVAVTDHDVADAALLACGWRENATPQLELSSQHSWSTAQ